jgi:hypothetical protein
MAKVSTVGLDMPGDFPILPYEAVHKHVAGKLPIAAPDAFTVYALSWNGVARRFYSLGAMEAAYEATFPRSNKEQRQVQEEALFGFFSTALSVIECACFSLYCLARTSNPRAFPDHEKNMTPTSLLARLKKAHPAAPLTISLGALLTDPRFAKLSDIRNVLAHRGTPGRTKFWDPANTRPGSAIWHQGDIPVRAGLLHSWRRWLATVLRGLLRDAETFVVAHT